MTDIILSIHPKWAAKIYSGEKTIEVRKSFPKQNVNKVYIYETAPVKKITGFFVFTGLQSIICFSVRDACLTRKELLAYLGDYKGYLWKINFPVKFDTPKDIKGSVPQSWRYLKEGEKYD